MKSLKKMYPKRKRKIKKMVTGIATISFLTNEELRKEFPELIAYTGGSGFSSNRPIPNHEIVQ